MNRAAQALGRKAKGVPKNFTKIELARRKQRLALARAKRWPVKKGMTKEQHERLKIRGALGLGTYSMVKS